MSFTETGAYSDLLNPVKDPERSFAINISELLQNYVRSFVAGTVNFNSAALMIQGSSSIYGKKVEYLHNLAIKLYASLVKHKKDDGTKKDTKEREKHSKGSKFSDPFCSTDIKLGKNLSCLRKKFAAKTASGKKTSKKSENRVTFTPVDLLPLEGEDKGIELLDVTGQVVGNKNDFTLNKCKVTSSGWILLPTVSPDLIPSQFSNPDYTIEEKVLDDNMCNDSDSNTPDSSPLDEGYPPSSGSTDSPASDPLSQGASSVPSSQGTNSTVPSSQGTDEGVGSFPCTPQENGSQSESEACMEDPYQPESGHTTPLPLAETPMEGVQEGPDASSPNIEGNENIPLENASVVLRPRRSMRQALKICQLQQDVAPNQTEENVDAIQEKVEVVVVKKAIQKKNTCNLPSKLKNKNGVALNPASEFCARTFFSMDRKYSKSLSHSFEVRAFQNHNPIFDKFQSIQATLLAINQRKKGKANIVDILENDEEDEEIDPVGLELALEDPVGDADIQTALLEADDIIIENRIAQPTASVSDDENPIAENEPMFDDADEPMLNDDDDNLDESLAAFNEKELEDSFADAASRQCNLFREELQQYVQTSDMAERINAWEANMRPYLEGLKQREEFDINLYGSRILNAFKDSNRKQTITFRNFCKGKEKWEIHRYFMALLPLVNIGNVSIEAEKLNDDEEDILVTLLSRKMHHKELEEFGHNEGEHS